MLNATDVRRLLDSEPFLPFWVRLKDGSRVPVSRPDELAMPGDSMLMMHRGVRRLRLDEVESVSIDEDSEKRQMTLKAIRDLYHAEPFIPFAIRLTDGRSIMVRSREFFAAAPTGRTVTVYQPDGSFNVIDLLLVSDLEVAPPQLTEQGG